MYKTNGKQIMSLNNLSLNETGFVESIKSNSRIKRRLLDLGIINGTKITPILISPSGDPTAFEIRGCLIALRNDDSKNIYIRKSDVKWD